MAHFSFTRSSYDDCALKKKNDESEAPFQWATDNLVAESNEDCFLASSPFMHQPFKSVPSTAVDTESDLRGQTRPLSKCPSSRFNPDSSQVVKVNLRDCAEDKLTPQYTRTNRPCNILSGITINRFHPLCNDLQNVNNIHQNTYIGSNTRLAVKDAYQEKAEQASRGGDLVIDTKTPCNGCAFVILK